MDRKTKLCLDKVVTELQLEIVSAYNNSKKLSDSDRIVVSSYLKAISTINREFGTTYKTATLCYYDKERKVFDKTFKENFPKENRKNYVRAWENLRM